MISDQGETRLLHSAVFSQLFASVRIPDDESKLKSDHISSDKHGDAILSTACNVTGTYNSQVPSTAMPTQWRIWCLPHDAESAAATSNIVRVTTISSTML
jgi:hypothetical protein